MALNRLGFLLGPRIRLRLLALVIGTFGTFGYLASVGAPPGDEAATKAPEDAVKKAPSTAGDQRKAIDVARDFAKAVAGEDSPEYYRVLEKSLFTLKARDYGQISLAPGRRLEAQKGGDPAFRELRVRIQNEVADSASLYRDPTWQKNFHKWLNQSSLEEQPLRIIGGEPTNANEYQDCVAVGSDQGFCCSGTLISQSIVVTAAHCVRGDCAKRIFIGNNSNQPATGTVVAVRKAIPNPDYNVFTSGNDIAILILEKPVKNVTPRAIAASDAIDQAHIVRLVGFGITEFGAFGIQYKVDAIIASNACGAADAQQKYGCNADREIVAGGNGVDSCNGDSGGPAYVMVGGQLRLAGATSRATRNSARPCGDGGVYTRVDRYLPWIRDTAKAEKVEFE